MSDPLPVPESITLRDGREVTLRAVTSKDVPALYELGRAVHAAGEGMVRTVAEYEAEGVEYIRQSVEEAPPGSVRIVADGGGPALAGEVALWRPKIERMRHAATLGLGVHPDWQGVGLGRLLMRAVLNWAADPDTGLHRIDLWTLADNVRGRALYASCGFAETGVRADGVRRADGSWVDDIMMGRLAPFTNAS